MLDFTRKLTPSSRIKYFLWKAQHRDAVTLRLRSGPCLELRRKETCANNDYGIAYKVFVEDCYGGDDGVDPKDVRFIVDMGANVGFASLKFLYKYPNARVLAFEPHPDHARQFVRNMELNGLVHRVSMMSAGAGTRERSVSFVSNMSGSRVSREGEAGTITVRLLDALSMLKGRRIDLLKMDIEGGEYELMADDRFASLDVGQIVMEWHRRGDAAADKKWCQDQLAHLGFETTDIFSRYWGGVMWGRRTQKTKKASPAFANEAGVALSLGER